MQHFIFNVLWYLIDIGVEMEGCIQYFLSLILCIYISIVSSCQINIGPFIDELPKESLTNGQIWYIYANEAARDDHHISLRTTQLRLLLSIFSHSTSLRYWFYHLVCVSCCLRICWRLVFVAKDCREMLKKITLD